MSRGELMDRLLIVLGLEDEISPSGNDLLSTVSLAMKRIGGDKRMAQILLLFDQSLGNLELAMLPFAFFLAGSGHGVRHPGFMIDETDDSHRIADKLAVEGQGHRQGA